MSIRSCSITADILSVLTDGKIHTLREIAERVEVSFSSVRRHITALAYRYPIETFCGGEKKGGVYLDKRYMANGHLFTKAELDFGAKVFGALNRTEYAGEELKALDALAGYFTAYKKEGRFYER